MVQPGLRPGAGYTDYRNFEAVIDKARTACFNSGQRAVRTVMMSRYACYLVIQNADPAKEIVALGQTRPRRSFAARRSPASSGRTRRTSRSARKCGRRSKNSAAPCRRSWPPPRASRNWKPSDGCPSSRAKARRNEVRWRRGFPDKTSSFWRGTMPARAWAGKLAEFDVPHLRFGIGDLPSSEAWRRRPRSTAPQFSPAPKGERIRRRKTRRRKTH